MRRLLLAVLVALFVVATCPAWAGGSVNEDWIRVYNPATKGWVSVPQGGLMPALKLIWDKSNTVSTASGIGLNDSRMHWCDDFMEAVGVIANTVYSKAHWTKANGAGSGTATITAGANGLMVLDTLHVAQNDDIILTFTTANFSVAKTPTMEALVKPNSLTNCIYEVGWYVDGNDEVLFRFNPAVDATNWSVVYENNNGGEQVKTTTIVASTSVYVRLRIDILSTGAVNCYTNGALVKSFPAATVRTTVAFLPRFYAKVTDAAHATAKTLTIDYCKVWQDR